MRGAGVVIFVRISAIDSVTYAIGRLSYSRRNSRGSVKRLSALVVLAVPEVPVGWEGVRRDAVQVVNPVRVHGNDGVG